MILANQLSKTLLSCAAMKSFSLLLFFLLIESGINAQTTNISGVVNSYHSVTEILVSKEAVKLDNTTGLSYGNLVLLTQMKGASIIQTNTATFGDTTSLNNAGNYEVATICSISGDTVFFFHQLANNYSVSDKVQLVKFGEYISADITDTLKAQSWNPSTGKGGVIAISVQEDLFLNAPIYADAVGYKGGSFYLHNGTCGFFNPVGNGYAYDATSTTATNGAYKGEGVADVLSTVDGGRGAPANGGGGGNNHNNGGGGGSNLTTGGNGGGNFSTGPTGCTGNYQGRGGKALSNWANTKIFLGGGGGAGHANNTIQTNAGGNGGGIIFIMAKNITGNGFKISTNGQAGKSTSYDGASGGGAGGTIIMHVTGTYNSSLTVEAKGGNGGDEDDDLIAGRCYGAGGGGSGGVIYFNGITPGITTSVTGGNAGVNLDVNSCGTPAPASSGTAGFVIQNYSYRTSVTPSSSCVASALPVKLMYFEAVANSDKKVYMNWEVTNPEEADLFVIEKKNYLNRWTTITEIIPHQNIYQYQANDPAADIGENIYRLRINGKDNSIAYSAEKRILFRSQDFFSIYPNPAKDRIFIRGQLTPGMIIILTDLNGRLIQKTQVSNNNNSTQFQLPELSAGIYLIKINSYTEKLVIY